MTTNRPETAPKLSPGCRSEELTPSATATIRQKLEKATELIQRNACEEAVTLLSKALTDFPNNLNLYLKRCDCWIRRKEYHWAQHDIEQCLLIDVDNAEVYNIQGDIYRGQNRFYDAYHSWAHPSTKNRNDIKQKRDELQCAVTGGSLMSVITTSIDNELLRVLENPKDLDLLSLPDIHKKLDDCANILLVDDVALCNNIVSSLFLTHSYNKACCIMAQVIAWFPQHMPLFNWKKMIDCMGRCLFQDWSIHGRNAKFCANALTVLAADAQDDEIRRYAVKTLLIPMSLWLTDSTPAPIELQDDDFAVSGCSFVLRRHSAISWLEMLFEPMNSFTGDPLGSHYHLIEQELLLFHGNLFMFNQLLHIMHSEKVVSLIIPDIVSHVRGFTDVLALPSNKSILLDTVTTFSFFITCADATPVFSSAVCTGLLTILKTKNVSSTLITSQHASVPLLVVLSRLACSHSPALHLLEHLAMTHPGVVDSIRALAQVLEVPPKDSIKDFTDDTKDSASQEIDETPSTPSSISADSISDSDGPDISWEMVLKVNNDNRETCLLTYCSDHYRLQPVSVTDDDDVFIPLVLTDEIIPHQDKSSVKTDSHKTISNSISGNLQQVHGSENTFEIIGENGKVLLTVQQCGLNKEGTLRTLYYPIIYNNDIKDCVGGHVKLNFVPKNNWVSEEIYAKTAPDGITPRIVKKKSEITRDLAQAWCLREMVSRITGVEDEGLQGLMLRMTVADKRIWLTRQLKRHHQDGDNIAFVECSRNGDQFKELHNQYKNKIGLASSDICSEFEVRFREENSVGSAVVREWMEIVAASYRQSQNLIPHPNNGCYLIASDTLFRNPWWSVDFEMLGRMLGLAFYHQVTLDLPLDPSIWMMVLLPDEYQFPFDSDVDDNTKLHSDFNRLFPDCAKHNIKWLIENSVQLLGIDLTFTDLIPSSVKQDHNAEPVTVSISDILSCSGSTPSDSNDDSSSSSSSSSSTSNSDTTSGPAPISVELTPGGESILVTDDNKEDYVLLLQKWRLCTGVTRQVASLKKGISKVIPPSLMADIKKMLTPSELGLLLSGMQTIEIPDWKANSNYVGFPDGGETPVIKWFWEVMENWNSEGNTDRLQSALQFATGSRRVPVGGFACLVGHNGGQHQFTLSNAKHMSVTSLPRAQACICTVDLPPWESREVAVEKLTLAFDNRNLRFEEGFN